MSTTMARAILKHIINKKQEKHVKIYIEYVNKNISKYKHLEVTKKNEQAGRLP
jgi:hypothetical protein